MPCSIDIFLIPYIFKEIKDKCFVSSSGSLFDHFGDILLFIKSWEMIQLVVLKVGGMWKPDFKKAWLLTVECLDFCMFFVVFFRGNLTNSLTGADKQHKHHQTS